MCGFFYDKNCMISKLENLPNQTMNDSAKKKVKIKPEPAYEADDGPLTEEYMEFLIKKAAESRPKGKLISEVSLFDIDLDKSGKD